MKKASRFVIGLIAAWLPGQVNAAYYAQVCPTTGIVQMIRARGNLFENTTESGEEYLYWSDERVQAMNLDDLDLVEFRQCSCPKPIYQANTLCPLESTICGVPLDLSEAVLCFQDETSTMLVRNVSHFPDPAPTSALLWCRM